MSDSRLIRKVSFYLFTRPYLYYFLNGPVVNICGPFVFEDRFLPF